MQTCVSAEVSDLRSSFTTGAILMASGRVPKVTRIRRGERAARANGSTGETANLLVTRRGPEKSVSTAGNSTRPITPQGYLLVLWSAPLTAKRAHYIAWRPLSAAINLVQGAKYCPQTLLPGGEAGMYPAGSIPIVQHGVKRPARRRAVLAAFDGDQVCFGLRLVEYGPSEPVPGGLTASGHVIEALEAGGGEAAADRLGGCGCDGAG